VQGDATGSGGAARAGVAGVDAAVISMGEPRGQHSPQPSRCAILGVHDLS
jgi:hypothetical protein